MTDDTPDWAIEGMAEGGVPDWAKEEAGPAWAKEDTPDWAREPEQSSPWGAAIRGAVRGLVPSAASMAGFGAGAVPGSAFGPAGTVVGGLAGAIGAGYLAGRGQEAVLSALPEGVRETLGQSEAQRRADEEHKYAAMLGELGAGLPFMGPGAAGHAAKEGAGALARVWASQLASRVAGAGIAGGQEVVQQAIQGQDFDPTRVAIATGAGALLNKPTGWGKAAMGAGARPVARMLGRPPAAAPAAPGAEPPPPPPTELPEPGIPFGYQWDPQSPTQRLTINRYLDDGNAEIATPDGTTAVVPTNVLKAGLTHDPGGPPEPVAAPPEPSPAAQEISEAATAVEELQQALPALEQRAGEAKATLTTGEPAPRAPPILPEQIAAQEQMGAMARDLIQKAGPQASYLVDAATPPRPPELPIAPEDAARAADIAQRPPAQARAEAGLDDNGFPLRAPVPAVAPAPPAPDPLGMQQRGELSAQRAEEIRDQIRNHIRTEEGRVFGEDAEQWRRLHNHSDRAWDNARDAEAQEYDRQIATIESKVDPQLLDRFFKVTEVETADPEGWHELSRDLRGVEADRESAASVVSRKIRNLPDRLDNLSPLDRETLAVISHAMDMEARRGGNPMAMLQDAMRERLHRLGGERSPDAQEVVAGYMEKLRALMGEAPPPVAGLIEGRLDVPGTTTPAPGVHTDTIADFRMAAAQSPHPVTPITPHLNARDYVLNRGRATGNEHYTVLDPRTGEAITSGTSSLPDTTAIRIPVRLASDPAANLVVHHNHPTGWALSVADLRLLSHDGIGWMVAHTHDGETFAARLTLDRGLFNTGDPREVELRAAGLANADKAAAAQVIPSIKMHKMQGRITADEAERLASDLTMRALDAAGIIDYVGTRTAASHPLSPAIQDSILRRASMAARKAGIQNGIITDTVRPERDYRARIDRSAVGVRPDEAIAAISGDAQQRVAADAGSPGGGREGARGAGEAPQRVAALVGGGYLDSKPVIVTRAEAELTKLANSAKSVSLRAAQDLGLKVAPMAQGHWMGQAITKDFANYERGARYQRQSFDDPLAKYSQADQERMWEAADAAGVAGQVAGPEAMWGALKNLPPEQIASLVELDRYGAELWDRLKAQGEVKGDRIPFYATRMLVKIAEDGKVSRVGETGSGGANVLDQMGINLRTKGVERRKYLTAEETEAAGKARFGPEAELMRNIRVVPWAFERLEKAIATREMVNKLKQMSAVMGKEAVIDEPRSGYFTLPHPAFNTYGPRLEIEPGTGKRVVARDADGDPIIEKKPIYVSNEFEGPLRSVLRTEDGALYRGAMQIKQGATHAIMISPAIHNMVEYGRALPMMPGKVASGKVYFEGNALRRGIPYENALAHMGDKLAGRQEDLVINPVMRKAMYEHGLVDGGHRGFLQDITGLAEEPSLHAGRGMVAKLFGGIGDVYSPEVGTKIKKAIDAAGDFFHQALLWDRIADLKAGIYKHYFDHLQTNKGFDELTAGRTAAFLANRYSGFLPNEAMSQGARKLLNVILFSRSFKLGMAAIFKDMFTGMPRDLQAQILRDSGEIARAKAVSFARKKAINGFMVDLALFYLGNAALQTATALMFRDKSTSDVEREWLGTLQRALNRIYEHPLDALNPFETLASFSPLFENEPGKHERVWWSKTADGTNLYLRPPVGKTGEELSGWIDHPLQMLQHGASTLVRPLTNLWANDNGLGKQIYDPDAKGMTGVAANVGRVVWEFIKSQTPEQQAVALWKMATGDTREGDVPQALLPFAGLTVSRGAPGGEQQGILYQAQRQHKFEMQHAMPAVDDKIRHGKTEEAAQDMAKLGLSPGLIQYRIKAVTHPETRLSKRALQDFMRYATPEQRGQMERAFEGLSAP